MAQAAIELIGINKSFGAVRANRDINLEVARGTIHGIVGENGAGKSTLMSILYGFYQADSGEIRVGGKPVSIHTSNDAIALGIGMVHQHFMLVDNFTVLENVILGAESDALLKSSITKARSELDRLEREYGLEVDPDAVIEELPVGLQQRVEILKALYRGAEILILDEPTGVLTPAEADHLFRILKQLKDQGKTIVLITHKLREIMAITDTVSVMRQGTMVATRTTKETTVGELAELMVGRRVLLRVEKGQSEAGAVKLSVKNLTVKDQRGVTMVDDVSFDVRGGEIAMIFQEPMTSLNPVHSIGAQLTEAIRIHQGAEASSVEQRARDMLDVVHISDPARRMKQYPHELSGGMRQRVMIAMALSCRPKVLLADEPTTALDVTVQAQILKLMRELKREFGTAIILITHDMGVVAEMADRVAVMRDGRIVEAGPVLDIFERPQADYTRELLAAVPRLGAFAGTDAPPRVTATSRPPVPDGEAPVLSVKKLVVDYGASSSLFRRRASEAPAVQDVSFEIRPGRTLGLVGESGSGKSTTGKAVLGLVPFAGSVIIGGTSIHGLSAAAMRPVRRAAQMIFQDPYASLDPRMTVGAAIAEPLVIHGIGSRDDRRERVASLLARVGLEADHASRYPHEFSGGQRQRICIARALALEPKLIVADESVAALDVSVRARVLDLMLELQETLGLAYLFISHDMAVVERMSHDVAVMRAGRIVEAGPRRAVLSSPREDYTR
ncbi:MAG: dipeptide ABC transporter ATP-binding protein [Mesorhizobium sp.]|nr:MAG: dipeptide ABC transporter ATP-binding protein [Mesorhizobium sp.]